MLAKGVVDLKLASENPLLVLWMGFWISRLGLLSRFRTAKGPKPFRKEGLLSRFRTAKGPKPFRKENQGTQQPGGPKPIELWARWLIDLKSWVLTISLLMRVLNALEDETYYEY